MIFSDSPQQRALERMMTAVPRFRPKGGGIMVLHHFEYTAEMCDCRYCPYYRGKRKCTASQCPCIEERIVAGAASRAEVMAETMRDIHNGAFRRRLNQFIKESEELHMNFRNEKHRLAYDLREGESIAFATIEPSVAVNHAGTIITKEPIIFGEEGYIEFDDDSSPNFLGDKMSVEEFLNMDFSQDEDESQTMGGMQL